MSRIFNNQFEEKALSYLPLHIGRKIRSIYGDKGSLLTELRISEGAEIFVVTDNNGEFIPVICSGDDMRYIIRSLCGNSVYSHSESMKDGFITTTDGIRAGIAGRGVSDKGTLCGITDIKSVVLRIPRRFPGAARELYSLLEGYSWRGSVLVYSAPSGGKTTLLRELAAMTGSKATYKRTVIVDSRCEISCGIEGGNISTLLNYPRHKGIEIAVRTLSPELIICDEISSSEDVAAALECLGSGVTLVASAHGTYEDIFSIKAVRELLPFRFFSAYYGIVKKENTINGIITDAKEVSF